MKRRFLLFFALLAVLALLVTGCGGSGIDSGKIVAKEDIPAWTNTYFIMVGKVMVPMSQEEPEEWVLKLEACEQEKCKTGHVSVSESDWESAQIGELWVTEH